MSPEHKPEIDDNTLVSELHHGKWFTETWKRKCSEEKGEILVPIILYMDSIQVDSNQKNSVEPLNMTLGIFSDETRSTRPDAWETIYFHPKSRDKLKPIDNLNNLHNGLCAALRSFREACDSEEVFQWKNLPWNGKHFCVKMKFAIW